MIRKWNWSLSLFAVLTLFLGSCSPGGTNVSHATITSTQSIRAAYPEPATSTESIRPYKTRTALPTIWPTKTPFPTADREYPTPNLPPKDWPEFSGVFSYSCESRGDKTVETSLKYHIRYPPDWYRYPDLSFNPSAQYFQNFERTSIVLEDEPQSLGTVKLTISAVPCWASMEGCPGNLPELVPGLHGTHEVKKSEDDWTIWNISLHATEFEIYLTGYMPGSPADNAALIKVLDDMLSTIVVYEEEPCPPVKTPTLSPAYPTYTPSVHP